MNHFQPPKLILSPATPRMTHQRLAVALLFAVPWAAMLGLLWLFSLFPAVLERYALVPFLAFPEAYERLARSAARVFHAPLPAGPLWSVSVFQGLTVAFVAVLLISVVNTLCCSVSRWATVTELTEVALLVFMRGPAELSIGLYFTLWHSWRYLGRLLELNAGPLHLRPVSVKALCRLCSSA